jgi:hypothetical protein
VAAVTRNQRTADDAVEAEVLAARDDPSAWEPLDLVPPSSSPRPAWMLRNKHLDLAAKFHVLSVLHRLGAEANLALAQPDNVDITVLGKAGNAVTIDVKTVEGGEWFVDHFSARKHHYVVVVEFSPDPQNTAVPPRVYVVASEQLRRFVSRRKLKSVSLESLHRELAALDAWQQIISEQAA